MKSKGIEDIVIESGYKTKKKKNTGLKVMIFLLFIVLAVFVGAYFYLTNMNTVSAKEMFVTNISRVNVRDLLQADVYETTLEKINTKDFETDTNVTFTTTLENDELKNVDVSKLALELINKNDIDNSKSAIEAILKYAENEVYRLKSLSNEKTIALFLNEINDKYIGCDFEKLKDILNIEFDYQNIRSLKNAEKLDINEEDKEKYVKKYFSKIIESIPEERFSIQENIVIKKNDVSVDVAAYTLKLNTDELNNIIKDLLTTLKDDTELLKEFAIVSEEKQNDEADIIEDTEPEIETEVIPEEEQNQEELIPEDTDIPEEIVEDETVIEDATEEVTQEPVTETPVEDESSIPVITINPVGTIVPVEIDEGTKNIIKELGTNELESNKDMDMTEFLQRIIFGKKLDMTVEEIQKWIQKAIDEGDFYKNSSLNDNSDFVINVYASDEKIEKITAEFPDKTSWDIEFLSKSDKENGIKVTYLKNENSQTDGFSLDFNKIQNDANTTIKLTYNVIENEKINKKIILNLKTDGTVSSKELVNDIVLTISTNKGETKLIIDNTINFKDVDGIEDLTDENCLYLDRLSDEELNSTVEDLKNKIKTLYDNKKENLNFINTNTGGMTLEDISSTVTREEAENALITRVGNMMQEAIDNNQEFTIKNLENLTIEGYEVSATVTEENAKIVVDTHAFNIDQNFTLTYAE